MDLKVQLRSSKNYNLCNILKNFVIFLLFQSHRVASYILAFILCCFQPLDSFLLLSLSNHPESLKETQLALGKALNSVNAQQFLMTISPLILLRHLHFRDRIV